MAKDLKHYIDNPKEYSPDVISYVKNFGLQKKEIEELSQLKNNEGWKNLEVKIKEELQIRIRELVKDDLRVQTLIDVLAVTDIKNKTKMLDTAIEESLPE